MTTTAGPREVLAAARRARAELASVVAGAGGAGSVAQWAQVVGELQALVDVVTAVQDSAVVALAAVETEVAEDGTLVEVRHVPGHVALDAPAVISGVLCVSAVHAERRVREAVRVAADGPEGTPSCTGLGGLHVAMGDGRLDPYRAQVLAHELDEAPAQVARVVVEALEAWFEQEDATRLRRRCRRLLARICPDLLRQRAVRARSESGLRRWVDEPGVDTWLGTFPSEEACTAWAAIDALAQQYVRDGVCDRVDRARAKALTDLVTQQASIDVQVALTTTAGACGAPELDDARSTDLVAAAGVAGAEPVLVERGWLSQAIAATNCRTSRSGRVVMCDPATGALLDPDDALATDTYRPSARLARFVRARDGHCRFPGCHVSARFCDLDHVRPFPAGPTSAANLVCLCRRHHRVKQRPGWRAVLHPDATMTWTDPTGRTRTTDPPDRLHSTVLPDTGTDRPPPQTNHSPVLPDGPHSALEHHLEHAAACRVHVVHPAAAITYRAGPHQRHRRRPSSTDPPPF